MQVISWQMHQVELNSFASYGKCEMYLDNLTFPFWSAHCTFTDLVSVSTDSKSIISLPCYMLINLIMKWKDD